MVPKDHIDIQCPRCGSKMTIGWPTTRARRALAKCPSCQEDFPVAEAVERTILGRLDHGDLHLVSDDPDRDE